MPELNTGIVKANAYAIKVRKTLFAQLKDKIKKNEVPSSEVLRVSAEINKFVFEILQKLGVDKNDAIRIIVPYSIDEGKIKYDLGMIKIEIWKKMPEKLVDEAIKGALSEIKNESS